MDIQLMVLAFQVAFSILCLTVGAWQDIRERIVTDRVVLIFTGGGLVLSLLYILVSPTPRQDLAKFALNVGVGIALGLSLFYVGVWGGGDSKMLMALSIASPFALPNYVPRDLLSEILPPVFIIYTNQLVITLIVPISFLVSNLILRLFQPWFNEVEGNILQKMSVLVSSAPILKEKAVTLRHIDFAEINETVEKQIEEYLSNENLRKEQQKTNQNTDQSEKGKNANQNKTEGHPKEEKRSTKEESEKQKENQNELVSSSSWRLFTRVFLEDEELEEKIREWTKEELVKDVKKTKVWVRFQPPGLVFMLAGYLSWILGYDFIMQLVHYLVQG